MGGFFFLRHYVRPRPHYSLPRSFKRRTNFNPDQTSVTAQTLTSTNPDASPISRTTFSLKSVATPELFFGQLAHIMPAGASSRLSGLNSLARSALDLVNTIM